MKGQFEMAKKRMFSLSVLDTDAFMDMPLSAQALYFHLNLRADDDGFIGNPKRVTQNIGANLDDLKLLVAKRFVIAFDDGVIVIKHWRMHNAIKKDRYTETNFIEDLQMLDVKENGAYTLTSGAQLEDKRSTNGAQTEQVGSVGKVRVDKKRLDKERVGESTRATEEDGKKPYGQYQNVMLSDAEYKILKDQFVNADSLIENFSEKLKTKGYSYASHYAAIISWEKKDRAEREKKGHRYDYDAMFSTQFEATG